MRSGGASGAGGTTAARGVLADTWVIEEHCIAVFLREEVPLSQDGCNVATRGPFSGLSGVLMDDGSLTLDGALGVMELAPAQ